MKDKKGEIDSNIIKVGDFTTPLTSLDKSSRQNNQQRNSNHK